MNRQENAIDPDEPPIVVKLGLWGLSDRASVVSFFWLCIALSVASLIVGVFEPLFLIGLLFLISALWYWVALRWVDQHGMWPKKGPKQGDR